MGNELWQMSNGGYMDREGNQSFNGPATYSQPSSSGSVTTPMNNDVITQQYTALFANARTPDEQARVREAYARALSQQAPAGTTQQRQWQVDDRNYSTPNATTQRDWQTQDNDRMMAEDSRRFDATNQLRQMAMQNMGNVWGGVSGRSGASFGGQPAQAQPTFQWNPGTQGGLNNDLTSYLSRLLGRK